MEQREKVRVSGWRMHVCVGWWVSSRWVSEQVDMWVGEWVALGWVGEWTGWVFR